MTDSCNMSKVSQKVTNNRCAISPQLFIITFRRVLWDRDADTNHLTINNFYRLIIILSMKHEMESKILLSAYIFKIRQWTGSW